jgi:hypothetical protein
MLHDPARHEALQDLPWDPDRVRAAIAHIAHECAQRFSPQTWWPLHPRDIEPGDDPAAPATPMYHGAAGVIWALHYLRDVGAVPDLPHFATHLETLRERNSAWLATMPGDESASFQMGELPLLMMQQGAAPEAARAERMAALIAGNLEHPARELMWGAPGTMLAAWFLHRRFGPDDRRWADLFRRSAARLREQLQWSEAHGCAYWTQDLYGQQATYLDGVHGFVATAGVLLRGRELLGPDEWAFWLDTIATTVSRTATWEDGRANWRVWLDLPPGRPVKWLMQFCHGAPGFVIHLAGFPLGPLDELLLAAGEAVWAAGPLAKGSNLCHGTGGNGYAFLVLYERTGDERWLQRARAFAMHGLAQMEADERAHGRLRYSLWTGDPGFAIYLWDCLRARAAFPTLDVFYGAPAATS